MALSKAAYDLVRWAVPDFHDKTPYDSSNVWTLAALILIIGIQIHLLLRYNPSTTLPLRASLIPVATIFALKGAYAHYYTDTGADQLNGRGQHVNIAIGCGAMCMIIWTFRWGLVGQRPRLKVAQKPAESNAKSAGVPDRKTSAVEELPLYFPAWHQPVPFFTLRQRWRWVLRTLAPVPLYYLVYDAIFTLIGDDRFNVHAGSATGGSIWACRQGFFGAAGPYLMCAAYGITFTCSMYLQHAAVASIAVGLFGDPPLRWDPPAFRQPWLSTSVHQFWSKRWHQYLRFSFLAAGFWPVQPLVQGMLGRRAAYAVGTFGAFLASAAVHHFGSAAVTPGHNLGNLEVAMFFIIQPLAIFGEQLWQHCTGYRVRGFFGWLWTMTWMLATAPLLFDSISFGLTQHYLPRALDWWDDFNATK
ncbi:hypothetical protein PANT_7c00102 [Moesziomyces antarcticus T-34]|uniref:Wax synthase domain-containing protein n=1 Tax=Pseudozyma antarctica (strain T-34) TaxID=1151754 RepID=M9LYY7_PSEA3|nr:hypothetical protein PANT_7c00102 [Moesziomyces antarcticus T-34]